MGDQEKEQASPAAAVDAPVYERPAVMWEEELEVRPSLALACGKVGGNDCLFNGGITS